MLRLGQQAGLTAPDAYVCTWAAEGVQSRGIVVRLFLDSSREELNLGSVLLRERDRAYDPESRWMQTLPRVRAALEALGTPSLLTDFTRLLAFDGWIGNADRHQENWGVITSAAGGTRLAPMFDPASCLGAELQEGNKHFSRSPNAQMMSKYIEQCGSGFGDGMAGIPLRTVMEELRSWPEWKSQASSWVADFRSAMDTFQGFLVAVPTVWLPDHRKRFVLELLEARLSWMERLL